ncbi:MAG: penicillin-binding protein 1B [Gammaproteobacteria bacterium]|nr:penicillin-binding protein 1B [Gammaproteobacteria bacterium]
MIKKRPPAPRKQKKKAVKSAEKPRRKRRVAPKKRRTVKKKGPSRLRRLLLRSLLLILPLFLLYVGWLDWSVREQFDGKRWELPARVYAAPLELYVGKPITRTAVVDALRELGYSERSRVSRAGSYSNHREQLRLHSRPFQFWDGEEPAVVAELTFYDGKIDALRALDSGEPLEILRLDPLTIGNFFPANGEDRQLVQLDELPEILTQTLITVEDRAFYSHFGINPLAIARALLVNLRAGRMVQGGSTLTQQLAKNLFLSRERSLWRKFREALITLILESHYEKEVLLEAYLNEVYFGQDQQRSIHGVGMASQFFFGQDASQLNLAESALLVGMLKAPSRYNPRRHPERAKQRRDLVLNLLAEQGVISEEEARAARRLPLGVLKKKPFGRSRYPAFLELVRHQILRDYPRKDLTSAGLQIFTTLDPRVQRAAEEGLQQRIQELDGGSRDIQGAVVVIHPGSGEVEAVVGGREPRGTGFNRALNAIRPIGSLVKPALFLAALEQPERYTLVSPLADRPFQLRSGDTVWEPKNYDERSHGEVMLYQSLSHSYNLSTARLGAALGIGRVARTLQRLGVAREIPRYPSLFLGALELSPLEVAQLYQPLAGGGIQTPLRAIRGVVDFEGNPLHRYPLHVDEVATPESVVLLQWGLQEVVRNGTAKGLQQMVSADLGVAGKTGTTDGLRDSWFAGFSAERLAVVWMGRDDNQPAGMTGSSGALHVWGKLIAALPSRPLQLRYPEHVAEVWVDPEGRSLRAGCGGGRWIPFVKGSEPRVEVGCKGG